MADDDLAARVAAIRDKTSHILSVASPSPDLMRANERAYAALETLLRAHEPVQIFRTADDCGHPRPDEGERDGEALSEWTDDHPPGYGITPDTDADVGAICLLSPDGPACRACTELVYGTWGDEGRWIAASDCIVRPLIARELTGETGHA